MQAYLLKNDERNVQLQQKKAQTLKSAATADMDKGSKDTFDRYDMLFIFQIVGAIIGATVSFWNFRNLVIQEQFVEKTKTYLQERRWIVWVVAVLIIAIAIGVIVFFRLLNERNNIDSQTLNNQQPDAAASTTFAASNTLS